MRSATSEPATRRSRRLEGDEGGGAELHAPGLRSAVGDDVAAELAACGLDGHVDLARGHAVALGHELEVVDEALHGRVQLVARRQDDLAVVHDPRALGHAVEALLDDARRLAHLVHAHLVAVVDVSVGVDRHVEVDLVVGEVGLRPCAGPSRLPRRAGPGPTGRARSRPPRRAGRCPSSARARSPAGRGAPRTRRRGPGTCPRTSGTP